MNLKVKTIKNSKGEEFDILVIEYITKAGKTAEVSVYDLNKKENYNLKKYITKQCKGE